MVSYNQPLKDPVNKVHEELDTRASEIMNRSYVTIKSEQNITEVAKVIAENGLTGAPVVNDRGMLIGVISEKDCLKYLLDLKYYNSEDAPVSKYMSKTVMTIDESEKLMYMTELFIKNNYQLYPVIDEDGLLKGVITRSILFKELNKLSQTNW